MTKKKQAINKYQLITDKLITSIKKGVQPWKKLWHSTPYSNLISGHKYQGINPLLCAIDNDYNDRSEPFFIGFYQAKELGWKVKKGSKSTWLHWGGTVTNKDENKTYSTAKWHNVFNIEAIDDSESDKKIADYIEQRKQSIPKNISPRIDLAEILIEEQKADIEFGGNIAYYCDRSDKIKIPRYEDFSNAIAYYSTLIHELAHWTGHYSRLNRDMSGDKRSKSYAKEELVAELAAAFVCNELFIDYELENHASYLDSWLWLLEGDNKAFFNAARLAQKASNLLLSNTGISEYES